MKKIIPTIIVEDWCDDCPFFHLNEYCEKDKRQRSVEYKENMMDKYFAIPDWCPLETVE